MMSGRSIIGNPGYDITQEFRDYVYGVSHDVGAPVRAMVEFSRLLSSEHCRELNEEGRLFLSLIIENGEKLQNMMAGLLDYSRLNTEAKPFARTDCQNILQNCLILLAEKIAASGAKIEYGPLSEVYADAGQITQLFTALLDNALKFQPPGQSPHIKVTSEMGEDFCVFRIEDNGIGIDDRYQKKIFQIFQRLHSEEDYSGVGMGLALSQKIVRRHGGEIWIDSGAGQGSVFCFTLPITHS